MTLRVLVVGAGIAGLTLAAALERRGVHATVVERDREAGRGYMLGLYRIAAHILSSLNGADQQLEQAAVPIDHYRLVDGGGRTVLDADVQAALTGFGPLLGVDRRTMLDLLGGRWSGQGPGSTDGDVAAQPRTRQYPVLGPGAGRWSFVHIDDAVTATVAAVESDITGAFNVCDDEPVPLSRWLPAFARYLGAPTPRHVPISSDTDPDAHFYAELLREADNHRARQELGFRPRPLPWLEEGSR